MKTPKRIADLLTRKQSYIDSQRNKLESSVIKLQSELFNSLIADIIPELDMKDGLIQDTPKNYKLITQLDKTYKDFQSVSKGIVLSQIITTTSKIADLSNKYFTLVLSEVPDKFAKVVTDANKLINLQIGLEGDKVFKGGWLDSYFNSNTIGLDLKKLVSQAVTSNMDRKELTTILKDKITGTADYKGGLERQFNMYTYDLYQQFDAAYNMMIGNEFGFNYFIYQGGIIEDSRDFCVCHNNKVWSKDEMKEWVNWTPSMGEYPAGYEVKAKDIYSVPSYMNFPGYDPGLNRGGYHCRHSLGWIDDTLAEKMRSNLSIEYDKPPDEVNTESNDASNFIPVNNIPEAELRFKELGVNQVNLTGMSLDHSNQMLKTIQAIPKSGRPTFFGTGSEFDKLTNGVIRNSGRKANQWYGISTSTEIWQNGKFVPLKAIGINSRQFNTLDKITEAKTASNLRYNTKTGNDWFFNTKGELTHFHETGHIFEQRYGVPSDWNFQSAKWFNETKIGVLKSPTEAWAEAWADLYGNNGNRLPTYIKDLMENHIKKY